MFKCTCFFVFQMEPLHRMRLAPAPFLKMPPRRKPSRAAVSWALLAMWLQVVFAGLHLATVSHALGGPVANQAAIWTICTAEGNILTLDESGDPISRGIETLCAICVSGVADGLVLDMPQPVALNFSPPILYDRPLPGFDTPWWKPSPRVGTSRAPPLL